MYFPFIQNITIGYSVSSEILYVFLSDQAHIVWFLQPTWRKKHYLIISFINFRFFTWQATMLPLWDISSRMVGMWRGRSLFLNIVLFGKTLNYHVVIDHIFVLYFLFQVGFRSRGLFLNTLTGGSIFNLGGRGRVVCGVPLHFWGTNITSGGPLLVLGMKSQVYSTYIFKIPEPLLQDSRQ